jgi:hypothetical protein
MAALLSGLGVAPALRGRVFNLTKEMLIQYYK